MWKYKITKTELGFGVFRERETEYGKEAEYRTGKFRDVRKINMKSYFTMEDAEGGLVMGRIHGK